MKTRGSWKQNPEAVRRDILRAAISEFAKNGLSGARIDDIAAQTRTSKRMIYYYFTDKETLYGHALEAAYSTVREGEAKLDLSGLGPEEALSRLRSPISLDVGAGSPAEVAVAILAEILAVRAERRTVEPLRDGSGPLHARTAASG